MSLKEDYVRVRKRDLERLTTEVMQLREFLPKVLNGDLIELLHKARAAETLKACNEQDQLRQECQNLRSRLDAAQSQAEGEREEKLILREQLWESREQLRQQAEFCTELGAAACTLLWSVSSKEAAVTDMLADGKLGPFLAVAGQTLESFVKSLGEDGKMEQRDLCSHDNQFVLALAGVITNIAAVTCGRDFLASSAPVLLDTLTQLLGMMKPGACSKLKVLMLMALYNVCVCLKMVRFILSGETLFKRLILLFPLLGDGDWEVCLHALRLLQSLALEEAGLAPALRERLPLARIRQLSSSPHATLRQAAQDMLEDLRHLTPAQQAPESGQRPLQEPTPHCRGESPWGGKTT
ncbi:heat shock factor 2-binding protein [Anguilla rostrata]|uniref:heat shock factor 2-binding protein n=1 Tax=Anguilla rostrata TaxID=7938 RepID=UPI0030D4F695